jgi:DNA recombination protein RmuC
MMTMETILLIVIALLAGASFLLFAMKESIRKEMRAYREETDRNLSALRMELAQALNENMRQLNDAMHKNMMTTGELQRQRFDAMARQQDELVRSTEKRLDDMRDMVEEKLQKTLNERISQSFEMVRAHLESVQRGLGEMKNLAQDVGGLKRVLSNVKARGTFGEIQLGALLEQMLSPEQYEANVKTKRGGTEFVEYAIKLPGKEDKEGVVYLPIDAKFPKDTYEHYYDAFEAGDTAMMESAGKQLETAIKRMAKDIHDKYIDPPHTTDFGIMFLPFESIYAEVIRRTALVESLQRDYRVVVTGPTTLGAILNSLQMGFRTLAIQKRTSEVWSVLGAVKGEFGKFGALLEKVQKNLQQAGNQIEDLMGVRTRAIENKLRKVEELPSDDDSHTPIAGV